jgi:putative transposase
MRKSRFSEEQITGGLKGHQAGLRVAEICRRHAISDATFYTWREVRRARGLGGEAAEDARGGEPEARRRSLAASHPGMRAQAALVYPEPSVRGIAVPGTASRRAHTMRHRDHDASLATPKPTNALDMLEIRRLQ